MQIQLSVDSTAVKVPGKALVTDAFAQLLSHQCSCGHDRDMHRHFRAGTDCGSCGPVTCTSFTTGARVESRWRFMSQGWQALRHPQSPRVGSAEAQEDPTGEAPSYDPFRRRAS